jgi:nucleoside-diphosphate-sugar epimerase
VRLLVLGGTTFLGRSVVDSALVSGHEVTLFNRGRTNADLYPDVERLRGDLTADVDALRGRAWDAAVDLDATTLPRHVRRYAGLLRDAVGHFVFVSTISAYADPSRPLDEDSPLHEPPSPEPDEFTEQHYGGLKAGCERAVQAVFGTRATIVRPGLIAGPHDPSDRFTYWPRRLSAGGDVLAPGDPSRPVQLVDARDLGAWLVRLAERREAGVFNATGPAEPLTLGELLERTAAAVGADARLVWIDAQTILDAGVGPWRELPLWLPGGEYDGLLRADIGRALAAGLTFRPLEETARDTLAWDRMIEGARPTLGREKEREILARARARR